MNLVIEVIITGLLIGGIYAMLSVGLTLVFGVMRIINFAYGDFVIVGMYVTLFFHSVTNVQPYIAALIVAPIFFVGGALVYSMFLLPLAKRTDAAVGQTIVTLGLSLMIVNLLTLRVGTTSRVLSTGITAASLRFHGIAIREAYLVGFGLAVVVTAVMWLWLRRTRSGKAVRAVAQDRVAAELLGVSPRRAELITFGVGSALAGVAGVVMIPFFGVSPTKDIALALTAYIVVVLGGLGSVPGAVVGGIIIGLIESITSFYVNNELSVVFYLAVFLVVLIIRPSGLFGSRTWDVRAS